MNSNKSTFQFLHPHVTKLPAVDRHTVSLFTSQLMLLLISKKEDHNTNFMPHYKTVATSTSTSWQEFNLKNTVQSFHTSDPAEMRDQFIQKKTQNLGELIFLNLLMSNDFNPECLGIIRHIETTEPFFTQKKTWCWTGFFSPEPQTLFFTQPLEISLRTYLQTLCEQHATWWHDAGIMPLEDNHALFFNDFFKIMLRIYLTPHHVIDLLASNIFSHYSNGPCFVTHVLHRFARIKKSFRSLLTIQQKNDWDAMLQKHGTDYYEAYAHDIKSFISCSTELENAMLAQAMQLGISDLDQARFVSHINIHSSPEHLHIIFDYFLQRLHEHWPQLKTDQLYFVWHLLDVIGKKLHHTPKKIIFPGSHVLICCYLIVQSIFFAHNNIAIFLIHHLPGLDINQPLPDNRWLLEEHPDWIKHSVLYMSLKYQNLAVADYLKSKGAVLCPDECTPTVPRLRSSRVSLSDSLYTLHVEKKVSPSHNRASRQSFDGDLHSFAVHNHRSALQDATTLEEALQRLSFK